jgi:hypothetical protein
MAQDAAPKSYFANGNSTTEHWLTRHHADGMDTLDKADARTAPSQAMNEREFRSWSYDKVLESNRSVLPG